MHHHKASCLSFHVSLSIILNHASLFRVVNESDVVDQVPEEGFLADPSPGYCDPSLEPDYYTQQGKPRCI